jgi:hypothetical protein
MHVGPFSTIEHHVYNRLSKNGDHISLQFCVTAKFSQLLRCKIYNANAPKPVAHLRRQLVIMYNNNFGTANVEFKEH